MDQISKFHLPFLTMPQFAALPCFLLKALSLLYFIVNCLMRYRTLLSVTSINSTSHSGILCSIAGI